MFLLRGLKRRDHKIISGFLWVLVYLTRSRTGFRGFRTQLEDVLDVLVILGLLHTFGFFPPSFPSLREVNAA